MSYADPAFNLFFVSNKGVISADLVLFEDGVRTGMGRIDCKSMSGMLGKHALKLELTNDDDVVVVKVGPDTLRMRRYPGKEHFFGVLRKEVDKGKTISASDALKKLRQQ